jgi:hypothetical protein
MLVLADNPPRIETVYNNFANDAFFLKTLGLNGVCTEWCPTSPKFPSPKVFFPLLPPLFFLYINYNWLALWRELCWWCIQIHIHRLVWQNATRNRYFPVLPSRFPSLLLFIPFLGTQLPQSAYLALNTPYVLFGLGRTSNYIEQFFYGVPLNQSTHFNYWTGSTIPNSQVKPTLPFFFSPFLFFSSFLFLFLSFSLPFFFSSFLYCSSHLTLHRWWQCHTNQILHQDGHWNCTLLLLVYFSGL